MSTTAAIIQTTLSKWAEAHLTALIQAKDKHAFDQAFDALYGSGLVSITLNGDTLHRDQYKQKLLEDFAIDSKLGADVTFQSAVEVAPEKGADIHIRGSVGIAFTAIINRKIRIHDTPLQTKVVSSLNVGVITVDTIPGSPRPGHGTPELRRINRVDQILLVEAVPAHITPPHGHSN